MAYSILWSQRGYGSFEKKTLVVIPEGLGDKIKLIGCKPPVVK
jgi:hypothetical protein